jgi:hypothetical protein
MLQHEVLERINDYDFALNISVCLVFVESPSNQQSTYQPLTTLMTTKNINFIALSE